MTDFIENTADQTADSTFTDEKIENETPDTVTFEDLGLDEYTLKAVEKKGSMGIVIPGGKFRLIDVNGNEITEPFVTGELVYEGKNVTLGYAECGNDLIKGDEHISEIDCKVFIIRTKIR